MAVEKFQLDMAGLLKVLAEHIYSTNLVGIRELIQNAFDATQRRLVEQRPAKYRPRIDIFTDRAAGTLAVCDNGAGLTDDEIRRYLVVIGASGTRNLRGELIGQPEADHLIGCFGIGFLSGFTLGSQIELITRSYQSDEALRFLCAGDEHFSLTQCERVEVGTTVVLQLKSELSYLLDEPRLVQIICKYADFLPVPIHINGARQPVNQQAPPWTNTDPIAAAKAEVKRQQGEEPLAIIGLRNERVQLGHDTLTVPLRGFLWVPRNSQPAISPRAELRVYVRRMLIRHDERHLLPKHAFVCGVVECPLLQPTASRETLVQDDAYEAVARAIGRQLTAGLCRLARRQPEVWKEIVVHHANSLLTGAVQDRKFQSLVEDVLPLPTSRGSQTLPAYLKNSGGEIYYSTRQMGSLQEQVLAEAHGLPVIDASVLTVKTFLDRYAETHPATQLVQLDGNSFHLFRPSTDTSCQSILNYFRQRGQDAEFVVFRPTTIPALIVSTERAELARETRTALMNRSIPLSVANLLRQFVDHTEQQGESLQGILMLNASCPLWKKLPAVDDLGEPRITAVLEIVYQQARFFAGRLLNTTEASAAFDAINQAVMELLP